jgi:exodeoxyribonuclease VII small subunit
MTYENAINRIEQIAEVLDDGSTSIDDSMSLFEEALSLISFCDKKLKQIQQKVTILTDDDKETEFNINEG